MTPIFVTLPISGSPGQTKAREASTCSFPPGYEGKVPETGYFVYHSPTYSTLMLVRAFVGEEGIKATVKKVKDTMRIYPYEQRNNPPDTDFVNLSGKKDQHGPRQRLQLLRRNQRSHSERAR